MLNFQKSPDLIPITIKTDNLTIRTDARLAFRQDEDGNFNVAVHAVHNKPELGSSKKLKIRKPPDIK